MTNEEIKENTEKEEKCECKYCKALKKILATAIGTFIGFYCAMSLFFVMHRPPVMCPCHKFKKHYGFEKNFEHKGKPFMEHNKIKMNKPFKPGEVPQKPDFEN